MQHTAYTPQQHAAAACPSSRIQYSQQLSLAQHQLESSNLQQGIHAKDEVCTVMLWLNTDSIVTACNVVRLMSQIALMQRTPASLGGT